MELERQPNAILRRINITDGQWNDLQGNDKTRIHFNTNETAIFFFTATLRSFPLVK